MNPSHAEFESPRSPTCFLEVRDLSKRFGAFTALDCVSMGVSAGEFVSVLGPSGCGKTTLLRVIAGLEPQNEGTVWIDGQDVSREPVAQRNMGIVFQSYALFPNINVLKNVEYGLRRHSTAQRRQRALEMLELVGLTDQIAKYPAQLSGGQQQRVALARALAPNPALLLLDEPLSALDARVRQRLRGEIRRIQQHLGVTTVMVTHDQEEALTMADRIVVMDQGRLMQFSEPKRVYARPANTFVAGFIGAMNFLPQCRWDAEGQARFLNYALDINGSDQMLCATAAPITLAIRPEHVRVGLHAEHLNNRIGARVRQIEFRGSVSRVHLQILDADGSLSPHLLEMELQPKAVDQLRLADQEALEVHLPPRHLLAFPQTESHAFDCAGLKKATPRA